MYRIFCDEKILYHPLLDDYSITSGKLNQEVNKAGTLTIVIPSSNKHYQLPKLRNSVITLYDENELIFRGVPYEPLRNLYADNKLMIAGELSFFNDSIIPPFEHYYGDVETFLKKIINEHNKQVDTFKQFKIGNITVKNNTEEGYITRASDHAVTSWTMIEDKLLKPLGGYLYVRHETDGVYIDYKDDLNYQSNQPVKQSLNLVDAEDSIETDGLATILYPYGARLKNKQGQEIEKRLTIENVNSKKLFIENKEAIAVYGRIAKTIIYEDITDASNLKKAAQRDLGASIATRNIKIKAADLGKAKEGLKPFRICDNVAVNVENLGINQRMMIKKINVDLLAPEETTIEVGSSLKDFTKYFSSYEKPLNGKNGANGEDATVLRIDSSRGTVFKNNSIATVLSVAIYRGAKRITNISQLKEEFGDTARLEWKWQKIGENVFGIILDSDPKIGENGFTLTLIPEEVDTKVTFMCNLIV